MEIFVCFFFCRDAAIVMLSGQVADGFATIFIGELVTLFWILNFSITQDLFYGNA